MAKKDMKRHTVPEGFGEERGDVPQMPVSMDQYIQPRALQVEAQLCNLLAERNSQVLQLLSRVQQLQNEVKQLKQ